MKKYLIGLIIALLIVIGLGCYLVQSLIDAKTSPTWNTFFGNVPSVQIKRYYDTNYGCLYVSISGASICFLNKELCFLEFPYNLDAALIASFFMYVGHLVNHFRVVELCLTSSSKLRFFWLLIIFAVLWFLGICFGWDGFEMYNATYNTPLISFLTALLGIASICALSSIYQQDTLSKWGGVTIIIYTLHKCFIPFFVPIYKVLFESMGYLDSTILPSIFCIIISLCITSCTYFIAKYLALKTPWLLGKF